MLDLEIPPERSNCRAPTPVSARMRALEAELNSYTGGSGGAGASTDAVRNLVYDTLPKLLQMMSKFHDEVRDFECDELLNEYELTLDVLLALGPSGL